MKKVLLASTALVLTAGVAAADVSLGGSANFGLKYDGGAADDELTLHYEVDFGVSGSGTTDSGIAFGASIDLDAEIDGPSGDPSTNDVGDPEVFISGAFGTLTVGALDPATDPFGIADIGFDGIGVDDDVDVLRTALSSANVNYEYVFGDVSVLLSYHTVDDDYGINVTYSGSQFNIGIGYADAGDSASLDRFGIDIDDITDSSTISLNGSVDFGNVNVGAHYATWDAESTSLGDLEADSFGIDVSYSSGATTVTAAYGTIDVEGVDNDDDYGIGVAYDLGGGAELAGGIGSVDGETKADLGLNLSF